MKNTRGLSLLVATTMIATMQAETENLPGRTQNLNICKITENAWVEFSAGKDDTQNILRDLARNADNPDFEFSIKVTLKSVAIIQEIERDGTDNIGNDALAMRIARSVRDSNKIAGKKQGFLESLATHDPEALMFIFGAYMEKKEAEILRNAAQSEQNRDELLFSLDQDGKTAFDLVEEKQAAGHPGAVLMKIGLDEIKRNHIKKQEEEKKEAAAVELQEKLGLEQK